MAARRLRKKTTPGTSGVQNSIQHKRAKGGQTTKGLPPCFSHVPIGQRNVTDRSRTLLYHKNQIRFNNSLRLFNFQFWSILCFWQLWWAKTRLFASQKRKENASKLGQLYRHCISDSLSIWDSTTDNNSKSTMDRISDCQSYPCLCVARQVIFGTKWIKKVGKGKIEVVLWG